MLLEHQIQEMSIPIKYDGDYSKCDVAKDKCPYRGIPYLGPNMVHGSLWNAAAEERTAPLFSQRV